MMFKKQKRMVQGEFWVNAEKYELPAANPFYERLDALLSSIGFDEQVRTLCQPYYRIGGPGHPGVDPAVYIKMLLIGFFENVKSERAIEARCADSIMLRRFLGYPLNERVPDHTTLGVIRRRLPVDTFEKAFGLSLPVLATMGLLRGAHIGADTSVMEANASMRNLRNRISSQKYRAYVKGLAKAEGVDITDEAAVSRFDRKRKGRKTSNDQWQNPHDPDAKIGPTKQGGIRMVYKPEHIIDMETGAIIDAKVLPGDTADSSGVADRIVAAENRAVASLPIDALPIETATTDKGYYAAAEIAKIELIGIGANIPDRCQHRNLDNLSKTTRKAVARCARRVKSAVGKDLLRKRGMHIERSFAHILDCGGMRRTTLRGNENIQKRYSIAAFGYNLSLIMLTFFGIGTPKQCAAGAWKWSFDDFLRCIHDFMTHSILFCRGATIHAVVAVAP
jgi:transposase